MPYLIRTNSQSAKRIEWRLFANVMSLLHMLCPQVKLRGRIYLSWNLKIICHFATGSLHHQGIVSYGIVCLRETAYWLRTNQIVRLVQERRNSIVGAQELRISCTKLPKYSYAYSYASYAYFSPTTPLQCLHVMQAKPCLIHHSRGWS